MVWRGRDHSQDDAAEDGRYDNGGPGGNRVVNEKKCVVIAIAITFILAIIGYALKYLFWVNVFEGVVR